MTITERAPAKINLFLHVGERRADGFHPLQSLAVFADAGDVLEISPAGGLGLTVDGPFAQSLSGEPDNLVLKAARALDASAGAALRLTKNLPVASGIGGGSADAAAALRGLSRFWRTDAAALPAITVGLGSDIPVCLASVPAFMEGRGEILRPVAALPRLALLLVNPGIAVSTRDVFCGLGARRGTDMALPEGGFADTADLLRFLESTGNDLEAPARALQPVIGDVIAALGAQAGALLARMSGSGATCFGIFADDDCCRRAAASLSAAHPQWWVAPSFVPQAGQAGAAAELGREIGPGPDGL